MADFLTTAEVADTLGVTPRTVRRYARSGLLEALSLPGRTLVSRDSLLAFLQDRTAPTIDLTDRKDH